MESVSEKKYTGLESQFFTWKGWDEPDTGAFHFYNCVLNTDIGSFKKGDKIQCVFFSIVESVMEFYDENAKEIGKFKLKISAQPYESEQDT